MGGVRCCVWLLAILMWSGDASAATKTRIAVYALKAPPELERLAQRTSEELLIHLGKRSDLTVLSQQEIEILLGHQADEQSVGACEGSDACLAKLTEIVDVEKVITGRLGTLGPGYLVTLALSDAKSAAIDRAESATTDDETELVEAVDQAIDRLLGGAPQKQTFRLELGSREAKAAVLGFAAEGHRAELGPSLTQLLALELKKVEGLSVISRDEIETMLKYEADKQLIQCKSDIACIIEIGGALGVDYLVSGAIGQLDDTTVISLKLFDVAHSEVKARVAESFRGPESTLAPALRFAVWSLLGRPVEGRGSLAILSDPEDARASIDGGEAIGLPHAAIDDLAAGKHSLSVSAPDHRPLFEDAYVEAGAETKVHVELTEIPLPWYAKWWVWTIIGVGAAAGATTAILATRPTTGDVDAHIGAGR